MSNVLTKLKRHKTFNMRLVDVQFDKFMTFMKLPTGCAVMIAFIYLRRWSIVWWFQRINALVSFSSQTVPVSMFCKPKLFKINNVSFNHRKNFPVVATLRALGAVLYEKHLCDVLIILVPDIKKTNPPEKRLFQYCEWVISTNVTTQKRLTWPLKKFF